MQQYSGGDRMVNIEINTNLVASYSKITVTEIEPKKSDVNSKISELESKISSGNFSSDENVANLNSMKAYCQMI